MLTGFFFFKAYKKLRKLCVAILLETCVKDIWMNRHWAYWCIPMYSTLLIIFIHSNAIILFYHRSLCLRNCCVRIIYVSPFLCPYHVSSVVWQHRSCRLTAWKLPYVRNILKEKYLQKDFIVFCWEGFQIDRISPGFDLMLTIFLLPLGVWSIILLLDLWLKFNTDTVEM